MFRNFPSVIKVGNIPVRVEFCDDVNEESAWGNYHPIHFRIRFQKEMPCAGKAIEVVLHEILHAVFHCADLSDKDEEERTVSTFSTWLAMVFMDNPALVRWIASATK